jgi:transposase
VTDVARKLNVSEETVSGVLDRWVETSVDWSSFLSIAVIGIDEISVKRGHRDYIAIVTTKSATGVVILGVLGDRKKESVLAFLKSIPEIDFMWLRPIVRVWMRCANGNSGV